MTAAKADGTAQGGSDCQVGGVPLDSQACEFYQAAMDLMNRSGIKYLVGGAYAFERYTGIARHTKDFDIFVTWDDAEKALKAFADAGYESEMTFPHWLGKAHKGDLYVDIIFSSGNGVADVDDAWFAHAVDGQVLGRPAKLVPPEEMIWQKSFVMERERYDGADVAHLLRACSQDLDWGRLVDHYGFYWRVLYSHLVLFGFIYPAERDKIPGHIMKELSHRLEGELSAPPPSGKMCQGTVISRGQYLVDVQEWGYQDGRQEPRGNMSKGEIKQWTDAIEEQK